MLRKLRIHMISITVLALPLAGCFERGQTAMPSALAEDDDTFCRAGGKAA